MAANLSHIRASYVMPLFFNQKNADSLISLLRHYETYPRDLMRMIMFVLVDDCSPVGIEIPDDIDLNWTLYRVDSDIEWNQAGARNLGATMAPSENLVLTDVDHTFPEALLRRICETRIPLRRFYKFKRANPDGSKKHSACNILLLSKGGFFESMGYDEEFCGHYGYEDVAFRHTLAHLGYKLRYLTRRVRIVSTEIDRNESYHSLERSLEHNERLLQKKLPLIDSRYPLAGHSRRFLNFEWHKVGMHLMD